METEGIVNKIAQSGLITLDLTEYLPSKDDCVVFDLKPFLFKGMILREKDFRTALKEQDWEVFRDKHITLTCSADAIIPMWAYMLVTTYLQPVAKGIYTGNEDELSQTVLLNRIEALNPEEYSDKRIVIKGCGDKPVSAAAYVTIMKKLQPVVKSLMFGEPCSTVPVYKQKKK